MASFSTKSFEKKLKEMSSRQDSVQTVSLWLIHHRAHSKTVVNLWLDRMKKAKPDRRLVLFYLANDIIQNSRKKGKEFSQSFSKVLGDAMQYLRDTSIRSSVERVLKIWQERKVFQKDVVQKLLDQLNNVSAKPKIKPKPEISAPKKENDKVKKEKKTKRPVPANFKTVNVTHAIATMQGIEDESERRQTLVNQMRLDASSSEGIKQLKDYAGGNRFSLEFEESSTKYQDLFQSLENESQHRQVLINLLEDGDAYYQASLKEATIIANAYRSFGNRLHSMKKKLDNKIRKFATAEKEAPVSAPKASFLASGLSGILEQMNDSPVGTPNRSEKNDDAKEGEKAAGKEGNSKQDEAEGKIVDPSVDHVEVSDMDLDSESENGGDDTEPSAAPQLSDTNSSTSAVSTPKPVPAASAVATLSPSLNKASPTVQPQYGYTMTADNSEENEVSSPASHNSAPSPEGSPDLNLEIYEGPPAVNALSSNQLDVKTNQSFLSGVTNEQKPGVGSPGPNTMNLLTQVTNKQQQNDGSSSEGADNSARDSNISNTLIQDDSNRRPLINLLGNLLGPLVHSQANQGEVSETGNQAVKGAVQQGATNVESFDLAATDQVVTDVAEAASKADSGPSTDEEGAAGDNTPEHGLDFAQVSPIILRSNTLFPRPPNPPSFSSSGQMFQNRPPLGGPSFVSPDRMQGFPNEPGMFMRDGPQRPSIEEQLMEEQHLRSPGMRSQRMQAPPVEWNRGPFGPRGNVHPVRESRDPRLRRREMLGRSTDGPPFMDNVPPMEMRGRPPGIGHPVDGVPTFMERQGHDIRREEMEREEMIRRRLSVGDERDGLIPIEERERRNWLMREGRPPMELRPELHGERREGSFPFQRHERGVEIRESFHPIERHIDGSLERREGPHPLGVRDGPPYMRGHMNNPIDRRHPVDRPDLARERREPPPFDPRGPPMNRSEPHEFEGREPPVDRPMGTPDLHLTESHPFDQRGPPIEQLDGSHSTTVPAFDGTHPVGHENEFHPPEGAPDEVPTSEEELPVCEDSGDKSTVPQEQNPGEVFPEGGDEHPPEHIQEGPHPKMDKLDDFHNEMNKHLGGPMFRPRPQIRPPDERSMFDIRPEFHMDDRGPTFAPPGRRDDNRPMGGPFIPRHEGRGRFPVPRNFHPNFGGRHFRPPPEHVGGRPRFRPMYGGPRLKRPGGSFHPEPAKRPHY